MADPDIQMKVVEAFIGSEFCNQFGKSCFSYSKWTQNMGFTRVLKDSVIWAIRFWESSTFSYLSVYYLFLYSHLQYVCPIIFIYIFLEQVSVDMELKKKNKSAFFVLKQKGL